MEMTPLSRAFHSLEEARGYILSLNSILMETGHAGQKTEGAEKATEKEKD